MIAMVVIPAAVTILLLAPVVRAVRRRWQVRRMLRAISR
jgi:hypothetical protein